MGFWDAMRQSSQNTGTNLAQVLLHKSAQQDQRAAEKRRSVSDTLNMLGQTKSAPVARLLMNRASELGDPALADAAKDVHTNLQAGEISNAPAPQTLQDVMDLNEQYTPEALQKAQPYVQKNIDSLEPKEEPLRVENKGLPAGYYWDRDANDGLVIRQAEGLPEPTSDNKPDTTGLPKGYMWVAKEDGSWGMEKIPGAPEGEGGSFKDIQALRKEFLDQSKDFQDVRDGFARVQRAATSPSAAGDVALIFGFMKILDPGSVVREGEFATAENAQGVPDKVVNLYNRALTGERLPEPVRKDFLQQAQNLFSEQVQQHRKRVDTYSTLAKRNGFDPKDVVVDLLPSSALSNEEQIELDALREEAKKNNGQLPESKAARYNELLQKKRQ